MKNVAFKLFRFASGRMTISALASLCFLGLFPICCGGGFALHEPLPVEKAAPFLPQTNSKIIFGSSRDSDWQDLHGGQMFFQMYMMNFDGSDLKRIGFSNIDEAFPSISPDGNLIAYVLFPARGKAILRIANLITGEVKDFPSDDYGLFSTPSFSPDGKYLVVSSTLGTSNNCYTDEPDYCPTDLHIIDLSGKIIQRVTNNINQEYSAHFSPDGKTIAFLCNERNDDSFSESAACMVNRDGTGFKVLAKHAGSPSYSADSRYLVYVKRGADLYILDLDTKKETQITHSPDLMKGNPCFDYSGKYIFLCWPVK